MSFVSQVKTRIHPIGEPEHLLQIRAIGGLQGVISQLGAITLTGEFQGKSLILGEKVPGLVQQLLKNGVNEAMFVVYPRTKNGFVYQFQVIGVWKPSILDPDSGAQDELPEGENYFSIRGEVCRKVWWDEKYGPRVSIRVFGEHFVTVDFDPTQVRPYEGDFLSLDVILTVDGRLRAEQVEKISIPEAAVARPPRRQGHQVVRRRSSAA